MLSPATATALDDLLAAVRGVRGALLASTDGRPVLARLPGRDEGAAAAVVASSRALGDRLADLVGPGSLQEIVVRSTAGHVVLYAAGGRGVLTVLADGDVNLALLHRHARAALPALGAVVDDHLGIPAPAGAAAPETRR